MTTYTCTTAQAAAANLNTAEATAKGAATCANAKT